MSEQESTMAQDDNNLAPGDVVEGLRCEHVAQVGSVQPTSPLKNYLSTHINGKDAWSAGRINQGKEIEQETLIRG